MPDVTAPSIGPLDLVLHIGAGKTGTSSIQYFLNQNRARLADLGHLYPQAPGRTRHTQLGLFTKPDHALASIPSWRRQRERFASPEAFRRAFRRRLFKEINESGLSHVLLSDEGLYGSSNEAMRRLCAFVDQVAGSLRLVVYLRRQDDHLLSRYQQEVKVRETRRLTDWVQRLDLSRAYDYHARLRTWERLLEPESFVVRRYEHESFVDESLFQDFLDAAGIDTRADELEPVEPVNMSLDAEAVEFLRILNVYRVRGEGAALLEDNRTLAPRLAAASKGPTLAAPAPFLDAFMERWEASNRGVARDFLADETGRLFQAPRRTSNTTTDQRLEPSRLDHYLTMLGLPEQVHAPMRRLVEREVNRR